MIPATDRLESTAAYGRARSDIYALLAALLMQPPSAVVLEGIQSLDVEEALPQRLHAALVMLREAGRSYSPAEIELEFRELFIGLGCGEIVPFASWYRERRLMGGPLAELRGDLRGLGLCRCEGACEPEDHAGVLCEILAMISRADSGVSLETQGSFFKTHALPWLPRFFRDLKQLRGAAFYRDVGIPGEVFMNTEERYLSPTEFTGDAP
ncbi:MAG: molecular chaperone TorD family protein [Deltaproteobacteria bacterium]|nr:molecular chaperone TorD family protein [Deltaproteobacteria bacterium]